MPPHEKGRPSDSAYSSAKGSTLTSPDRRSSSSTASSQKEDLSSRHKMEELDSTIKQLKTDLDLKDKRVQGLIRDIKEKGNIIKDLGSV